MSRPDMTMKEAANKFNKKILHNKGRIEIISALFYLAYEFFLASISAKASFLERLILP